MPKGMGLDQNEEDKHQLKLSKRDHIHIDPEPRPFLALPFAPSGETITLPPRHIFSGSSSTND